MFPPGTCKRLQVDQKLLTSFRFSFDTLRPGKSPEVARVGIHPAHRATVLVPFLVRSLRTCASADAFSGLQIIPQFSAVSQAPSTVRSRSWSVLPGRLATRAVKNDWIHYQELCLRTLQNSPEFRFFASPESCPLCPLQWLVAYYSNLVMLGAFTLIISLLLASFAGYHVYLVCTNTTTNEVMFCALRSVAPLTFLNAIWRKCCSLGLLELRIQSWTLPFVRLASSPWRMCFPDSSVGANGRQSPQPKTGNKNRK
jgi:hypothetical protein